MSDYCGTGGWSGPLPGDPDNNSILSVTAVFGGVKVSWSYPTINPAAVAHTLVYRGVSNDFASARLLAVATGDSYFDMYDAQESVRYFYWIKIVSVYGTEGTLIGPATLYVTPTILSLINLLTGQLNESALTINLRSKITGIDGLTLNLAGEIQDRINSNIALGDVLSGIQVASGEMTAYILNETTNRVTADSAQVAAIQAMAVVNGSNSAAIANEAVVRLNVDNALASATSTLQTRVNGNTSSIQTNATTVNGLSAQYTVKVDVNGYVAGFGLASTPINGVPISEFTVVADRFSIAPVNSGDSSTAPFFHRTTASVINGVNIPAGTYMKAAYIHEASVDTLKIAGNAVTVTKIATQAGLIMGNDAYQTITYLVLDPLDIPSTLLITFMGYVGYTAGLFTTGWRLVRNGVVVYDTGMITAAFVVNPTLSFAQNLSANSGGEYYVQWYAASGTVGIQNGLMTAMSVKR